MYIRQPHMICMERWSRLDYLKLRTIESTLCERSIVMNKTGTFAHCAEAPRVLYILYLFKNKKM